MDLFNSPTSFRAYPFLLSVHILEHLSLPRCSRDIINRQTGRVDDFTFFNEQSLSGQALILPDQVSGET